MNSTLKVIGVTGSRSEYDIIYPVFKEMQKETGFDLSFVVCGGHLSDHFGYTIEEIESHSLRQKAQVRPLHKKYQWFLLSSCFSSSNTLQMVLVHIDLFNSLAIDLSVMIHRHLVNNKNLSWDHVVRDFIF